MRFHLASLAKALIAALMVGATAAAAGPGSLKAWLEPVSRDGMVEFQGYVAAPEPMTVTYRLRIVRIGPAGRSSTSQSGRVEIRQPDAPARLGLTAISVGPEDSYTAELVATGPDGEEIHVELTREPEDGNRL